MKSKLKILLISFILLCFFSACASQPYTVKKAQEVREETVKCFPDQRPKWMDYEPESDGKYDYFVGHSVKQSTEREARNEAMTDAIKQFVRFCGVEVNIFDEYVQKTTGKTSGVLTGELFGKGSETQQSQAFVSRIKAREWYVCGLRIYHDGTPISSGNKVSVLVKVPVEEKVRVQEYAENRKKNEQAAKITALEIRLKPAVTYYRQASEFMKDQQISAALDALGKAEEVVNRFKSDPSFTEAKNNIQQNLKEEVLDRIGIDKNLIINGIALDKLEGDGQKLTPENRLAKPLSVKAVCRFKEEDIPLMRVPLHFLTVQEDKEEILEKANTNEKGEAFLKVLPADYQSEHKIIARLVREPQREVYFNLTAPKPKPKKPELSIACNFMYEKNGREGKLENGMSLSSFVRPLEYSDKYQIWFSPSQDSYVYIYQVDSTGQAWQLFPNPDYSNAWNPVKQGKDYYWPDLPGSKWMTLDDHRGQERLYLVAAKEKNNPSLIKLRRIFDNLKKARKSQDNYRTRSLSHDIAAILDRIPAPTTRGFYKPVSGTNSSTSSHKKIYHDTSSFAKIAEQLSTSGGVLVEQRSFRHE